MERERTQILFVDSDENQLQSLHRNLREQASRWEMHFVTTGEAALAQMDSQPADIIITETQLQGTSGASLLKEVQARHPQTARLMLSGEVFRTPSREILHYAHQFIAKPCAIEELIALLERIDHLQSQLRDPSIEAMLGSIDTLPSLPHTYQRLITALRSENATMAEIGAIVSEDMSMATKVLQMVNSAFFGLPQKISSPEHAVSLLGLETVTNLALSVGLFEQIEPDLSREFELETLWKHSIRTAGLVRRLAADMGISRPASEIPILAGLLHDLGKLVLTSRDTQEYRLILRYVKETGQPLEQVEAEALWCNHARIGAFLMGLWGLPYAAVEAVAFHHDVTLQNSQRPDALLVFAANLLDESLQENPPPRITQITALAEIIPAAQFNRWKAIAEDFIRGQAA
jgi:HD-like signal output (HDOD) protein